MVQSTQRSGDVNIVHHTVESDTTFSQTKSVRVGRFTKGVEPVPVWCTVLIYIDFCGHYQAQTEVAATAKCY